MTYNPDQQQTYYYGDYKFIFNNQKLQYTTKIREVPLSFTYIPNDVESLTLSKETITNLKNTRVLAITYDPFVTESSILGMMQFILESELPRMNKMIVQRGLLNATGYALPEISCANATSAIPVLTLRMGDLAELRQEGSCFILQAPTQQQLLQHFDRLRYELYGVIQ